MALGIRVGADLAATGQSVDEEVYGAMEARFDGRADAFAYLLFILLYIPCAATIAAITREAGRSWALFVAVWTTGVAYVTATAFYQVATFGRHPLESAVWLVSLVLVGLAALVVLGHWARRPSPPAATPVFVRSRT